LHYPILPGFFQFKKNIVGLFAHPKDWIVIEMQAEPWGPDAVTNLSDADMAKTMTPEKLQYIFEFSANRQASKNFISGELSGGLGKNRSRGMIYYWNYAKTLFNK